ncbi:hypothetical protein AAV94_04580 [Lampropedia cohaerens]|uniref:Porin domain-containing protein n=1 Tax=Lampropedia cohaerens TaxID=1610491 RepID=A0A0U1Q0V4_9BURK|nr:porin [Lampropedia cohaerens]KKW68398.1 hypothetical protein AAV94_04580 [Lampropedia cohaerens]
MKHVALAPLATAAIASLAFSSAHAQSVRIHGTADVYVGSMKYAGNERQSRVGSGGMTTSYIGFSGSEDLGNGLKAGFAFGQFFRMDSGAQGRFNGDTTYARDANVSLSGGFGSIKLGRSSAPNFVPSLSANPFGASFGFSPLIVHMNTTTLNSGAFGYQRTTAADTGWSNQVVYSTPVIAGGLTVNLHYQFSNLADAGNSEDEKKNIGISGRYVHGPLMVTGFYEEAELTNPNVAGRTSDWLNAKNWMLGGTWDFEVVKAYLSYGAGEDLRIAGDETETWQVGASIPMGPAGKFLASYAETEFDPSNTVSDRTRKTLTVGYDYALSKRTDIYTIVMHDRFTGTDSGTSYALGIRHNF